MSVQLRMLFGDEVGIRHFWEDEVDRLIESGALFMANHSGGFAGSADPPAGARASVPTACRSRFAGSNGVAWSHGVGPGSSGRRCTALHRGQDLQDTA